MAHVVVIHNPRSGRGLASQLARRFVRALDEAGHDVHPVIAGEAPTPPDVLREADAMVLIGGDGTVNHAADTAVAAGAPIYHVGTGNENLVAGAFGMTRRPTQLLEALEQPRLAHIDLGRVTQGPAAGNPFLLMASVGPDASIIRRVARGRTRAIGHLAYVLPVLAEAFDTYTPELTIRVDGDLVVERERGLVLVANAPEYASNINPAASASLTDGKLDVLFLPCRTSLRAAGWALSARLRRTERVDASHAVRGHSVSIQTHDGPLVAQLDGEWAAARNGHRGATAWSLEVEPQRLPVLVPPDSRFPMPTVSEPEPMATA